MHIEVRRSRWRRALTAAELAAGAVFLALVFEMANGQSSLSAVQLAMVRLALAWYMVLGVPLLFAHVLWKARATWPTPPPMATRWVWRITVALMVMFFTPLEYMPVAYLIPGLMANTNLLIASIVVGEVGPVVLMWVLIHIAVLRGRPEDDYPPRSR